jgi:hypothetical protein
MFLEQVASANMRIFLGHPSAEDLKICKRAAEKARESTILDETTI